MKNIKKLFVVILSLILVFSLASCGNNKDTKIKLTPVFDYVLDAGIYKSLDYDFAEEYFRTHYDNDGGACTACAKVNSAGEMLIGRNMDLNISDRSAYIFRTDIEGCYKTINLMYTFREYAPHYKDVVEEGLPTEFGKVMPFFADDVLNEKGLYIEVNMRNGEYWPTGEPKFSCKGTNPKSDTDVYMFTLSRCIGDHCATVDEAIEYVKTLNVYSQYGYWNYCFLIADASGHYGVLEFADDEVIWNDMQPAQANFYINPDYQAIEELKAGLGRYKNVMEGRETVETEEDMFNLMDSVSYFQVYDPDNCKFDWRSENVGALKYATNEFVMDPKYQEFIYSEMKKQSAYVLSQTREQLRAANEFWESAFTEVINCNNRTLTVRFYENDDYKITLSFDDEIWGK